MDDSVASSVILVEAAAVVAISSVLFAQRGSYMLQNEEEEEDEEESYRYRIAIPYLQFDWDLNGLSDDWVEWKFRFSKREIHQILPYLSLDSCAWSSRCKPSEEMAFCMFLARLSYPLRLGDLVDDFGRSKSFISSVCTDVVLHLKKRFQQRLFWDSRRLTIEKLRSYASFIDRAGGGDIVWAYIDGTVQQICRPTKDQRLFYSGHKHYHGFKYQGIITPDGIFSSAFGPMIGSRGDWYLFQESGVEAKIDELFEGLENDQRLYVYGDPAYTGSGATIGAYKRPPGGEMTAAQHEFNATMAKTRVAVEHGFGYVQKKWLKNSFHSTMMVGSSPCGAYYLAAILMSNIMTCLRGGNQISQQFQCPPPSLNEYLEENDEFGAVEDVNFEE